MSSKISVIIRPSMDKYDQHDIPTLFLLVVKQPYDIF